MTQPDKPVTSRDALAIAVPIILSNVTTPLVGVADTAVMGRAGDPALIGAVALGAVIFSTVLWAFGFLRMGTTGITAQANGAANLNEINLALFRALTIAVVIGLALLALRSPIREAAFWILDGSQKAEAAATTYYNVRLWSAPFALINYALIGWFIGLARAQLAFTLQLLLNGINIILNITLVLGFGWGIEGVATATVIAETIAAFTGLAIAIHIARGAAPLPNWSQIREWTGLKRMLTVNSDIMIRTLCLIFAFSFFTAQSAKTTDTILAANFILIQFVTVSAYFLDGFSYAAETLVGKSVGAKNRDNFVQAVRISAIWAFAIAAFVSAFVWAAGSSLIAGMSTSEQVRTAAGAYLIWAALAPTIGVACYLLDGIFIGATETRTMRNMMLISVAAYLAAWWLLTDTFGNHGLWAALMIFFIARAVTLYLNLPKLMRRVFS